MNVSKNELRKKRFIKEFVAHKTIQSQENLKERRNRLECLLRDEIEHNYKVITALMSTRNQIENQNSKLEEKLEEEKKLEEKVKTLEKIEKLREIQRSPTYRYSLSKLLEKQVAETRDKEIELRKEFLTTLPASLSNSRRKK